MSSRTVDLCFTLLRFCLGFAKSILEEWNKDQLCNQIDRITFQLFAFVSYVTEAHYGGFFTGLFLNGNFYLKGFCED